MENSNYFTDSFSLLQNTLFKGALNIHETGSSLTTVNWTIVLTSFDKEEMAKKKKWQILNMQIQI